MESRTLGVMDPLLWWDSGLGWACWMKKVNYVYLLPPPPMTPMTLVSFNQQTVIVPS